MNPGSYMRAIALSVSLLLYYTLAFSQQLYVQKYPREVYHASSQNWFFAQDSKGMMCVANNDGILRHDGMNWDLLPLPDMNYVFSIAFDAHDRLYVGAYNELGYLQADEGGKYRYHSLLPLLPDSARNIKNVFQTIIYHDTVFFCNREEVCVYANGKFRVFSHRNGWLMQFLGRVYSINNGSLYVYNNERFEPVDLGQDKLGISILRVKDYYNNTCLLMDDKNRLWVFDPGAPAGNKLHPFPPCPGIDFSHFPLLNYLALDEGRVALVSEKGLYVVDKDGRLVNFISNEVLGADLRPSRLFRDACHNLWLSVDDNIFQIISSGPWSWYDSQNGINGQVTSLGRLGHQRFVGTNKGIFLQGEDKNFSLLPGTLGEAWNFYNFHEKLYAAHRTGVFELEENKATKLIDHEFVHSLCPLKRWPNRLLMGTFNTGIWVMEENNRRWTQWKIRGFEEETRFMQEDEEGNIWISIANKGVFKLRLNEPMDSVVSKTLYDDKNGLPSKLNNRLYRLNNGEMVVTTVDGIYRYDKASNRFVPAEQFRKTLGKGFCLYSIEESRDGDIYFWGMTPQGLETAGVIKKQPGGDFELVLTPFAKMVTASNGLHIDVDAPVMAQSTEDVWFGMKGKLLSYNPVQKIFYTEPVRVVIKQVRAGDSLVCLAKTRQELPYTRNNITVDLISNFYESPEKEEYQYRLEGFNYKWSVWGLSAQAVFTNLPEGNYTFWARTRNLYGKISEPVSFSFSILPPWYRSWWAWCLYTIVFIFFLYAVNRVNTLRIMKKNRVLEIKVEEKTREIAGQAKILQELNSTKDRLFSIISHDLKGPINILQGVVGMMKDSDLSEQTVRSFSAELNDYLLVTGHLLNNLLFWAKSQMEGIKAMPIAFDLHEIAEENDQLFRSLAETKHIRLINEVDPPLMVYADKEILKMVLRNLTNNAIKFTREEGQVTIGAKTGAGYAEVFIADTGTGISAADIDKILRKEAFHRVDTAGQAGTGLGLILCQEMMEKAGGRISIESAMDKGSRFFFRVNLFSAPAKK